MSAINETGDKNEPINVLFTLHEGFDTLDFAGPLEILKGARHDIKDPCTIFPQSHHLIIQLH
jgi:hypothetical protein